MIEKLQLEPGKKVLEVGTGSGYQAAVLAEMGADVVSIEVRAELAEMARMTLVREGYGDVVVLKGDGYSGAPAYAPFDAIIVACAPPAIPGELSEQLKDGGRMIVPVGKVAQKLVFVTRHSGKIKEEPDIDVVFVPMIHG
jgi:protein-L-isoaspartate(D-aspartate) O-methyltransferase